VAAYIHVYEYVSVYLYVCIYTNTDVSVYVKGRSDDASAKKEQVHMCRYMYIRICMYVYI